MISYAAITTTDDNNNANSSHHVQTPKAEIQRLVDEVLLLACVCLPKPCTVGGGTRV